MPWKYDSFGVFNHLFCYIIVNLSNRMGEERRWQNKSCVTSMTIILFEVTSLAFKQIFFVKDQKTLTLSEDQDLIFTTQQQPCHVCHTQAFFHPFLPAFLLRKLTMYHYNFATFQTVAMTTSFKEYRHLNPWGLFSHCFVKLNSSLELL